MVKEGMRRQTFTNRSGFTFLELLIVLTIMGVMTAMSLPKIFNVIHQTSARSARVGFGTLVVTARSVAVQRGCTATLHFTTGSAGLVWVTACKSASQSGIDTVGVVDQLATRFGVSIASSSSSLQFDSRGISIGYQPLTVVFTATSGGGTYKDSTVINQLGKVVH
jgi:prepilin-type N-terminal cleavage/methylation domain-containing protein